MKAESACFCMPEPCRLSVKTMRLRRIKSRCLSWNSSSRAQKHPVCFLFAYWFFLYDAFPSAVLGVSNRQNIEQFTNNEAAFFNNEKHERSKKKTLLQTIFTEERIVKRHKSLWWNATKVYDETAQKFMMKHHNSWFYASKNISFSCKYNWISITLHTSSITVTIWVIHIELQTFNWQSILRLLGRY